MELRKHLSLKSNYFRIVLVVLLIGVVVGIYGYYFPKKYLFECKGTSYLRMAYKVTDDTITFGQLQKTEVIKLFEYWNGLTYTLNYYTIRQCKTNLINSISCEQKADPKLDESYSHAELFNLDESTYSSEWIDYKDNKKWETSNVGFKCNPIKNALGK
jgi:hypothetical protein